MVAKRSPIWGDVDIEAFCATTGFSREHATRELSRLRQSCGLAFETKQRRKRGANKSTWGVMVADPAKLLFDKHSLFYDRKGRCLHNYTTLADEGEKLTPTITLPCPASRPRGRPRTRPVAPSEAKRSCGRPRKESMPPPTSDEGFPKSPVAPMSEQDGCVRFPCPKIPDNRRGCDNPLNKDSYGIQQSDLYGAKRDVALWRGREQRVAKPQALRRKAFAVQARLAGCHWDNCKVRFSRRTAHSYAFRALRDGHEERRIISCYEDALFVCHGFAVDRAASSAKIVLFNASSTIVKAAALLAKDGLDCRERTARWYANRVPQPQIDPAELAAIRAQIAATFRRDD